MTLESCVVSNNTAAMPNLGVTNETSTGGGIDCEAGTLTLSNCTVVNNLAAGAGTSSTEVGGGVYVNNAAATLGASGSVFQGNRAPGGFGGAVALGNGALNNCVLSSNAATFGGALWIGGNGQTMATNCLLAGNTASLGGAVYSSVATVAGDFENCTIARNSPDGFNAYTGIIHDSIVYSNGDEIVLGLVASPTVSYCDVQGGFSGRGTNNLEVDPQFANTSDFELAETSPLIDAGDPAPQFNDEAFPPSQGSIKTTSARMAGRGPDTGRRLRRCCRWSWSTARRRRPSSCSHFLTAAHQPSHLETDTRGEPSNTPWTARTRSSSRPTLARRLS